MSMGRRSATHQPTLWVTTTDLPQSPGHVFYERRNHLLAAAAFDRFVEHLCRPLSADDMGRASLPPGTYCRMPFVGHFEGLDSQRAIAWRCSDGLSLRAVLGIPLDEAPPDHSSPRRIRQRLPQDIHDRVLTHAPSIARETNLLRGKTVAVDSTTLEANAAMRAIVRKDTGENDRTDLRRLLNEHGVENPTDEEVRRFDKDRKKKVPNAERGSATDSDRRIAKMKDPTAHLADKAEHVVDRDSGLVVAAPVYPADHADAATLIDRVLLAQVDLVFAGREQEIDEAVADEGYHAAQTLADGERIQTRTYIPEPKREKRRWTDEPESHRRAVLADRRRVRGDRSKRLQRKRSELVERSFAHVCETGGGRRTQLRGGEDVTKRYAVQVAAFNLGIVMRHLCGVGKPRTRQGSGRRGGGSGGLGGVRSALRMRWICRQLALAVNRPAKIRPAINDRSSTGCYPVPNDWSVIGPLRRGTLWYQYSNVDQVRSIEQVLRGFAELNTSPDGKFVRVLIENQAVVHWWIEVNGANDPPVWVDNDQPDDPGEWTQVAATFSTYIWDWIAYHHDWLYTPPADAAPVIPLPGSPPPKPHTTGKWACTLRALYPFPVLDDLTERFGDSETVIVADGTTRHTFLTRDGTIRVTADDPGRPEMLAAWWVYSPTADGFERLAAVLKPWDVLGDSPRTVPIGDSNPLWGHLNE